MTQPIQVVVIDDHPLFSEGVARSLTEIGRFEVVGEGSTADDAVRLTREKSPDIILLDISMPGGGLNAMLPSSAIARRRRSCCLPPLRTAKIWLPP